MTREDFRRLGFVLRCNVSACNQQLSNLPEEAWITICNHIFCSHCGQSELDGSLPVNCPVCSHQLASPFDIIKTELNPPTHFIKMVLMGLTPEDCMDAAQNGLHFWESQYELQLSSQEAATHASQKQVQELHKHYEEKMAEMNRELAALREECHRTKEELKRRSMHPRASDCHDGRPELVAREKSASTKKASYPPPSIPPVRPTTLHDAKPKNRQFLGKQ